MILSKANKILARIYEFLCVVDQVSDGVCANKSNE